MKGVRPADTQKHWSHHGPAAPCSTPRPPSTRMSGLLTHGHENVGSVSAFISFLTNRTDAVLSSIGGASVAVAANPAPSRLR